MPRYKCRVLVHVYADVEVVANNQYEANRVAEQARIEDLSLAYIDTIDGFYADEIKTIGVEEAKKGSPDWEKFWTEQ